MDNILLDFEQAKAKHLLFKSRLRSILYGMEINELPVLSHFECGVGKWIYNHALTEYGHIAEIHELEKVHADLHAVARDLVAMYKTGKVEEARSGLSKAEAIADKLVALLSVVEKKVERNDVTNSHAGDYQSREISMQELIDLVKANEALDKLIKKQNDVFSKQRLLLLESFMHLPAYVSILQGKEHRIELMNEPAKQLVNNKDIIGKTVREAFPELEGQGYFELLDKVYNEGEPFTGKEMPVKVDLGNGMQLMYSNISYYPLKDIHGNAEGILSFSYDVTEQVLARQRIEEAAKRAEFITNAMPQMVWTTDAAGKSIFFNENWFQNTGKTFEVLLAEGWFSLIHTAEAETFLIAWKKSIETGNYFAVEHRLKMHNNEHRWHLTRAIPEKNSNDEIVGWIGTTTDIHDLKFLQDQLKQSYEDLEVKVKFRNLELEKQNKDLLNQLTSSQLNNS